MEKNNLSKTSKKSSWKTKIIILETLIIIALVAAGFGAYTYFGQKIKDSVKMQAQKEKLEKEKARCSAILAKQSGSFKDYEYCTQLINTFGQD
ncbi:MAG: hypothetical protein GF335_03755 [Candidatus Moranbacteria bacterium]|nr:hypothetical protein [Candidatus Moranbacteria bacterium]